MDTEVDEQRQVTAGAEAMGLRASGDTAPPSHHSRRDRWNGHGRRMAPDMSRGA